MVKLDRECCVYWIRRPHHTDIFTEGYVGITANSLHKRFNMHKYVARKGAKTIIAKALIKYNDLICEKILVGSIEYCLNIENKLRPVPGVGYNILVGGNTPMYNKPNSPEVSEKLSRAAKLAYINDPTLVDRCGKKNKGRKHSAETKEKLKLRNTPKAWCNGASSKEVWLMARQVYDYVDEHKCGHVKVAIHFGKPLWTFESVVKKIKNGWNPYTCQEWQEFYDKNTKEI